MEHFGSIYIDLHLRQSLFACLSDLSAGFCFHKGFQTLVRRFSMRFVFFVASVSNMSPPCCLGDPSVCASKEMNALRPLLSAHFKDRPTPAKFHSVATTTCAVCFVTSCSPRTFLGGKFREAFWMSFCMGSVQVTQVDLLPWKTWLVSMSSCS